MPYTHYPPVRSSIQPALVLMVASVTSHHQQRHRHLLIIIVVASCCFWLYLQYCMEIVFLFTACFMDKFVCRERCVQLKEFRPSHCPMYLFGRSFLFFFCGPIHQLSTHDVSVFIEKK